MSHDGATSGRADAPDSGVGAMRAVLIAGPTASGKSALAMRLAARHNGVVINADSMQVYRDLRIITARPTLADEAAATHRLYGHVDAVENYSVGGWISDVGAALTSIAAEGRLPILVGGTGLYFKALTEGLSSVPPTPPDVRTAVRARCDAEGVTALHAELAQRDPVMAARLRPNDGLRVCRALEVLEATGRSLADWHGEGMPAVLAPAQTVRVFLAVERKALKRRIDARFNEMLEAGALDEVRALAARRLDPMLPAMKAHGVPWLRQYFVGEVDLATAIEGGQRDTRRYTKRQETWFRNQMPGWRWLDPVAAEAAIDGAVAHKYA